MENHQRRRYRSSSSPLRIVGCFLLLCWFTLEVLYSNPIRTLRSLRRVKGGATPTTTGDTATDHNPSNHHVVVVQTYIMDYYSNYNIEQIKQNGLRSVHHIEDSFIEVWFPSYYIAWIIKRIKRYFLPSDLHRDDDDEEENEEEKIENKKMDHCSTIKLQSYDTNTQELNAVYFGRNFDWHHDTTLIIRIHNQYSDQFPFFRWLYYNENQNDNDDITSIAVLDLHYLNMDRVDLLSTNIIQRIPLLFVPYYVMDGMNQYGVAISDHVIPQMEPPPYHPQKPNIIHSTMARVILDYAQSTQEAISLIRNYNIIFPYAQIHFMIADATGNSKIVEFIDGQVRVTDSSTLEPQHSWQLCTNTIVWNKSEEVQDRLCPRYRTGSELADQLPSNVTLDDTIRVTRSMIKIGYTMWTSIYELKQRKSYHFYKTYPDIVHVDQIPTRLEQDQVQDDTVGVEEEL